MVGDMADVRLITLDPGHFHAALVQKEMYPKISERVHVFAPMGMDLVEHLARVARFNERAVEPTAWEEEVHASADFLDRMLADPPGNVVVLSGRNRVKIDYIQQSVENGLNVLADKPWIIRPADMGRLSSALDVADEESLIAFDIMTERFEVTSLLQRALVNDTEVFGEMVKGTAGSPGVYMESVHHIMKLVAGVPLQRPAWFFDITQQGEGLSDVGTHLVDLVQWTLFPEQAINHRADITIEAAKRWPTPLSAADFRRVTGAPEFPEYVRGHVKDGKLDYYCNNQVSYTLKGVHVKMDVLWNYEAPEGTGDTHYAVYRGTKANIEVRQGQAENFRPELYVIPIDETRMDEVERTVTVRVAALQEQHPGTGVMRRGEELLITIPDALRVGHEAHFAQVARQFLRYLSGAEKLPKWEKPNMLAKYWVTTKGVEAAG
jgi:predicted dehydrogenase